MTTTVNDRLKAVQKRLADDGVKDVKFFFNPGVGGVALSEVKESVALVMEAHCDGLLLPMPAMNDRYLAAAQ